MKKYILLILITILLSSCGKEDELVSKKYYSTGSVFSGSISNINTYIGYVKSNKSVDLGAKSGGKVSEIYVGVGDYVEKGSLLAKLDSGESRVGFSSSTDIVNSLINLRDTTSLTFDSQIKVMEEQIRQAEIGKNGTFEGLEDAKIISSAQLLSAESGVEQARLGLETAKLNYEHTKNILDTKLDNIYDNSTNAIVSSVILYVNTITFVDELLGVSPENRGKNDSFESYLSAKNISYIKESRDVFIEVDKLIKDYKQFYDTQVENQNPSIETINKGLEKGTIVAEKLKSLLNVTYNVLDNTIENINFNSDSINSYKSKISSFGVEIESSLITVSGEYILGLKGSKQNLENFNNEYSKQLDLLQKNIDLVNSSLVSAESTLSEISSVRDADIRNMSNKTDIALSQLRESKLLLEALLEQKKSKIAEINTKIYEARGENNLSWVMISNGEFRAPFSGIITSKNIELGQVLAPGYPAFNISNENDLIVNISIGIDNLSNIYLGKSVSIEIDGENTIIEGKITKIYPSKDISSKKSIVEISLIDNLNNIRLGSYSKVILDTSEGEGYKIISNNAIVSKFLVPGVYVINNGVAEFRNIEIINYNDSFSQIEGLDLNDVIIIGGKENIWDGEVLK